MLMSPIQVMMNGLSSMVHGCDASITMLLAKIPLEWIVIAQNIPDPDLFGRVQRAWAHFIQTGQIWAMIIGLILGYAIKGFTSFG